MYSAALDIQEVWRRYLPVSLAFDHDDCVEKDLKRCDTWTSARIVFTNKFLTDNARTDAMHRLFTMTMNKHESISSYMTRFLSTCIEAGANKNDPMVAARFKASFSEPVLEKLFQKETKVMVRLVLSFAQDMVVQMQITMKMIALVKRTKKMMLRRP
ncbi:hypothetical protein G6F43_014050 [Rhizopus delemar]|nr:hypothetical protein G6F43_014050 [Rhizopus delemar]